MNKLFGGTCLSVILASVVFFCFVNCGREAEINLVKNLTPIFSSELTCINNANEKGSQVILSIPSNLDGVMTGTLLCTTTFCTKYDSQEENCTVNAQEFIFFQADSLNSEPFIYTQFCETSQNGGVPIEINSRLICTGNIDNDTANVIDLTGPTCFCL